MKNEWSIQPDYYKAEMQYEPKHSCLILFYLDIHQNLPIIEEQADVEKHQISLYKEKKYLWGENWNSTNTIHPGVTSWRLVSKF